MTGKPDIEVHVRTHITGLQGAQCTACGLSMGLWTWSLHATARRGRTRWTRYCPDCARAIAAATPPAETPPEETHEPV